MRNTLIVHALIRLARERYGTCINQCHSLLSPARKLAHMLRDYNLENFSFFFSCKTKKFLSLPRLYTWRRETTIVTLVNVKMKLYLASADLI